MQLQGVSLRENSWGSDCDVNVITPQLDDHPLSFLDAFVPRKLIQQSAKKESKEGTATFSPKLTLKINKASV